MIQDAKKGFAPLTPILDNETFICTLTTRTAAELAGVGFSLGKLLPGGTVLVLSGELGAGKTTFVQGLARGMGIDATVTSPTFALVQVYESQPVSLVHCDFYRLENSAEIEQLGLNDYFTPQYLVAVEWGDAFLDSLPTGALRIAIAISEEGRSVRVSGPQLVVEELVRRCSS